MAARWVYVPSCPTRRVKRWRVVVGAQAARVLVVGAQAVRVLVVRSARRVRLRLPVLLKPVLVLVRGQAQPRANRVVQ